MNNPQRYKLIDGSFTASEATQILLSLVKSKIDFHNLEKLSNEERFGQDIAQSERRLTELRQLHETLRSACQSAAEKGQRVEVKGWIEMNLVPSNPSSVEPVE